MNSLPGRGEGQGSSVKMDFTPHMKPFLQFPRRLVVCPTNPRVE